MLSVSESCLAPLVLLLRSTSVFSGPLLSDGRNGRQSLSAEEKSNTRVCVEQTGIPHGSYARCATTGHKLVTMTERVGSGSGEEPEHGPDSIEQRPDEHPREDRKDQDDPAPGEAGS